MQIDCFETVSSSFRMDSFYIYMIQIFSIFIEKKGMNECVFELKCFIKNNITTGIYRKMEGNT